MFNLLSATAFNLNHSKILQFGKELRNLRKEAFEKTVGKRKKNVAFSLFSTTAFILSMENFDIWVIYNLSSASALNLDKFKIFR